MARRGGIEVALKIFTSVDDDAAALAKSEFEQVYNLNHENLLKPTDFGVYQARPYLVLPYCAQGSAFSKINRLSERELAQLMVDISSGLEYLHNLPEPMVHQDIKPENFLIDDQGNYLLSDFGMSKKMKRTMIKSITSGRQTQNLRDREKVGGATPAYAPPEFHDRNLQNRIARPASDVWSLGASLYELATGRLPFENFGGMIQKNGAQLAGFPVGKYSQAFEKLVTLCLQIDPKHRPTATELKNMGQAYLKKGKWPINKLNVSQVKSISITPKSDKKRRLPIFWIILGVVLTLLVVLYFFVIPRPGVPRIAFEADGKSGYRVSLDYIPNQSIRFENLSEEADTYQWTILNQDEVLMNKDTFELALVFPGAGTYQVSLTGENAETGKVRNRSKVLKLELSATYQEQALAVIQSAFDVLVDTTAGESTKVSAKNTILQLMAPSGQGIVNGVGVDLAAYIDQLITQPRGDLQSIQADANFNEIGLVQTLDLREIERSSSTENEEESIVEEGTEEKPADPDKDLDPGLTEITIKENPQLNPDQEAVKKASMSVLNKKKLKEKPKKPQE